FDSGEKIVLPALSDIGVENVDKLFISHPHRDHTGGLKALLSEEKVDSLYSVPLVGDAAFMQQLERNKSFGYRSLQRGEWMELDAETRLYVLGPSPQLLSNDALTSPINNRSLVLLIRHRNVSLIFTGDAEVDGERALLCWDDLLRSQVLKAGHHGSKTSSHTEFLEAVRPQLALISAGRRNRFRHPSPQTLSGIRKLNAKVLRTDLHGAVWLQLKKNTVIEKNWR
ncbi:MAG: MBL fold metallo-hydrolase, partial [Calditrichota bacterium]